MDDLRDLYQEVILDHGKHPRNHRHPPEANHSAKGDNPLCGDRVAVYLTLASDVIEDAAFEGRGCAICMASASMMTEILKGRRVPDAEALLDRFHAMCTGKEDEGAAKLAEIDEDALDRLRVLSGVRQFPMRVKCATLPWHTMAAAVHGGEKASTE